MEYISREEILAEYDRQHKGPAGGARKIMETWPAADVAPVRHGKWIKPTRVPDSMMDECSLCGFDCGAYTFIYCPNCGAKMDGGGDE